MWDEDLAEFNNPLPRWWTGLFYVTIVFGVVYLVLYPGFGSYSGVSAWTSSGQYKTETALAESRYGPTFNRYLGQGLEVVAADSEARAIGQRLFLTIARSVTVRMQVAELAFPTCATRTGSTAGSLKRSRRASWRVATA